MKAAPAATAASRTTANLLQAGGVATVDPMIRKRAIEFLIDAERIEARASTTGRPGVRYFVPSEYPVTLQ